MPSSRRVKTIPTVTRTETIAAAARSSMTPCSSGRRWRRPMAAGSGVAEVLAATAGGCLAGGGATGGVVQHLQVLVDGLLRGRHELRLLREADRILDVVPDEGRDLRLAAERLVLHVDEERPRKRVVAAGDRVRVGR